jgi:hypothetical protein
MAGSEKYYGPGSVVDAVPRLFRYLACIYAVLFLIGASLLRDPAYSRIKANSTEEPLRGGIEEEDGEGEAEDVKVGEAAGLVAPWA